MWPYAAGRARNSEFGCGKFYNEKNKRFFVVQPIENFLAWYDGHRLHVSRCKPRHTKPMTGIPDDRT